MIKYSFGKPCNSKTRIAKRNMKWLRHLTRNSASEDGLIYIDTRCAPFELGGILRPEDNGNEYYRLDSDKRDTYSDANRGLGEHTAGGPPHCHGQRHPECRRHDRRTEPEVQPGSSGSYYAGNH